jgi:uncharacterized protein YkwD
MFFSLRRASLGFAATLLIIMLLQSISATAAPRVSGTSSLVYLPIVSSSAAESPRIAMARQVVELTNQERARYGCAPLAISAQLSAAADRHSRDMAVNDRFSHTGSDGSTMEGRVQDAGYSYKRLAENIAVGQSTPADVVSAWMNSTGHRQNILNCELHEIGVGFYDQSDDQPTVLDDSGHKSGPYRYYWTEDFGTHQ